jgi:hypothetical protein
MTTTMIQQRFPIKFDKWYKILSSTLFLFPSSSYVEVDGEEVRVQMGWAFRSCFAKAAIVSAAETHEKTFSRGVHGFAGQWLVNGSGQGILTINLTSNQRGYVMGIPVCLEQLMLSAENPVALIAALTKAS